MIDNSPRMQAAGIALVIFGTIGVSAGIAFCAYDLNQPGDFSGIGCAAVGIPVASIGTSLVVTGTPLWVIGARDVVVSADDPRVKAQYGNAPGAAPEITVSGSGIVARWRF